MMEAIERVFCWGVLRLQPGDPLAAESRNPPVDDSRWELMESIIRENPNLKRKGEPDSILKRFRKACEKNDLPGIAETKGLAMIREIMGTRKQK
jgi:hypothetical protein